MTFPSYEVLMVTHADPRRLEDLCLLKMDHLPTDYLTLSLPEALMEYYEQYTVTVGRSYPKSMESLFNEMESQSGRRPRGKG